MSEFEKLDKMSREVFVVELLLRVSALETLLIKKGIVTDKEISDEIKIVSDQLLEKVQKDPVIGERLKKIQQEKN